MWIEYSGVRFATYMDDFLVSSAEDVFIGDAYRVDGAAISLQSRSHLQRVQVVDLQHLELNV